MTSLTFQQLHNFFYQMISFKLIKKGAQMVINILKDGTVVDDMSQVTVPNEIVQAVQRIVERKVNDEKKNT